MPLAYVLILFMTADAPAPALPSEPEPHRGGAVMPGAIGRVLGVVRKLIDYGKELAATLQRRAAAPGFAQFARPFGTADLAVILVRITSGLHRAASLEARLCRLAARGQDLTPSPVRVPAAQEASDAAQVARVDARPRPGRTDPAEDPRLARLPTEEEIAAEVRRRPVGAVIADICRDLGIVPGELDRAFWDELRRAIMFYGGSLAGFVGNLSKRLFACHSADQSDHLDPASPAAPPGSPALATGPPRS
jgi:hypothetical protein